MDVETAKAPTELAGSPEHRERLRPILAELDASGHSTFLDLCELVLMLSEQVDGSIKWTHPRVLVHIKQKPRPSKKGTR